jgi:ABC-type nickel/cobalt efflux system permease component RcnA
MGNFSISHYSNLKVNVTGIELTYIIDMAEVPTFQDKSELDLNANGEIEPTEKELYLSKKAALLLRGLVLKVNGANLRLKEISKQLDLLPGGLNLPTTKIRLQLQSDYQPAQLREVNSLEFQDNNFSDRLGWKEIVAQPASGIDFVDSSVPAVDKTRELSAYPEDPTVSPPQDLKAQVRFHFPTQLSGVVASPLARQEANLRTSPLTMGTTEQSFQQNDVRTQREQQRLTQLLSSSVLGPNVIMLAMFVAFGLGAFHALSPGHGKTVVGAYLVGSRGTARHAIILGAIVTVTHTLGVFLLGLVTLYASKYILPEKLYPWLGFFSGLAVVTIGIGLFLQRYKNLHARPPASQSHTHEPTEFHHHHDHDGVAAGDSHPAASHHDHSHHHEPSHVHEHIHIHGHSHAMEGHDHDHDHHHEHHAHTHGPVASHSHTHGESLTHSHGGTTHTHDYSNVRFKDLFTLGVSGGIVPCPSALVVLLSAISLNRVGLGLLMIVAFSLGLALVLMAIGLMMVYARGFMERLGSGGRLWQTLPVFSPLVIAALGAVIALQALVGAGIVQINLSGLN